MSIHWKVNTPVRLCPQANCLSTRPPFVDYKQTLPTAINMLSPVICTRCFVIQRYAAAPPNGFSRFTWSTTLVFLWLGIARYHRSYLPAENNERQPVLLRSPTFFNSVYGAPCTVFCGTLFPENCRIQSRCKIFRA